MTKIIISIGLLALFAAGSAQEDGTASETALPLAYARIYSDDDGDSHFSTDHMEFQHITISPDLPPVSAAAPSPATQLVVASAPSGGLADWHPVPRRQINIVLSGEIEIEVSDGETRRFGPGSYILGEDTTGQGHRTRVVSEDAVYFAIVALDAD